MLIESLVEKGVFMHQPLSFVDPSYHTKVCKLHKALYWLK